MYNLVLLGGAIFLMTYIRTGFVKYLESIRGLHLKGNLLFEGTALFPTPFSTCGSFLVFKDPTMVLIDFLSGWR